MADDPPNDLVSAILATSPTVRLLSTPRWDRLWVFWSPERRPRIPESIQEKIVYAFNSLENYHYGLVIQFWAPVKTGSKILLSTSNQPFASANLKFGHDKYRSCSLKYQYDIDWTNLEDEYDPMIISGAPASAFLNRIPELLPDPRVYQRNPLVSCALECGLRYSVFLPLYDRHRNCCIGVVECSMGYSYKLFELFNALITKLEKVGLKTYDARQLLQYNKLDVCKYFIPIKQTICGLQHAKDEINEALKIIWQTHGLESAQVWIASKEENHLTLLSTLEAVETTRMLGVKLIGHFDRNVKTDPGDVSCFKVYNDACDILPLKMEEGLCGKTLQNYEPHFIKDVINSNDDDDDDKPQRLLYISIECSCFVIYLRSTKTGDLLYVFEFLWSQGSSRTDNILFESLLLTLKRCLPSFKFASSVELGDELRILDVDNSTETETKYIKIFQTNKLSPVSVTPKRGTRPEDEECLTPLKEKCKTTPIPLSQEDIQPHFGKTMIEAAKSLNVSLSTLKRKCKVLGIPEWQGKDYLRRNVKHSYKNQSNTNEEHIGSIQDLLANNGEMNLDEINLTVKAEYAGDMIKFHLPISSATFEAIEKEISNQFNLNPANYKLVYLDKDNEWILLASDEGLKVCMGDRINSTSIVRLCLLPRQISAPSRTFQFT